MKKPGRDKLDRFLLELNDSGFSNLEISRQVGLSQSFVEKCLRGRKRFIWKLPSIPPITKRWRGGTERASMELKRMKKSIGENLAWLWTVVDEPVQLVTRRGPGRRAAIRPHRALVEQAVQTLALLCGVQPTEIWRWIFPSRARHIYRHVRRGPHTPGLGKMKDA